MSPEMPDFDTRWTLFLDRDGVINVHLRDDWVKRWDEFVFIEGAKESLSVLSRIFGRIIVVTNQRGIALGLMTSGELEGIHDRMADEVSRAGGRIDATMYCPHDKEERCACRKPAIGMALEAKRIFPEIDFSHSIMVGDSSSDMQFGLNAGMHIAFIPGHEGDSFDGAPLFPSLKDFVSAIRRKI